MAGLILPGARCGTLSPVPSLLIYANQTDKTNGGAGYIGSAACSACHPGLAESHGLHGHASALTPIDGQPPTYPADATGAGVPDAPAGFTFNDIAYVVGGHSKGAQFVDLDGFLLTTGGTGTATQWNLDFTPNGTAAGFADFGAAEPSNLPFDFDRFASLTTGAAPQDPAAPRFQDNRPGMAGTFAEPGVQCEACHGPGSNHPPNTGARALFVDPTGADSCKQCHVRPFGAPGDEIRAEDGFILPLSQYAELRASGGHAGFSCTFCHDPHVSVAYDRSNAIRNECTACHSEQNMALHAGKVLTRGDYVETLACQSCHMPFATRRFSAAAPVVVGDAGHMGDTRTHIFRINTDQVGSEAMFNEDGSRVALDDQGRAAVTVDYVCLRCHNGIGAFKLSIDSAADVALRIHVEP